MSKTTQELWAHEDCEDFIIECRKCGEPMVSFSYSNDLCEWCVIEMIMEDAPSIAEAKDNG